MLESKLTLKQERNHDLNVEFLYGGVELYRMIAEHTGLAKARRLLSVARGSPSPHPCERALRLLAPLAQSVLDGDASWDDAVNHLDRLTWQQNAN